MILPKKIALQINWYEYTTAERGSQIYDVFTIHFKPWWKRNQVISIRRRREANGDGTFCWTIVPAAHELLEFLQEVVNNTWQQKKSGVTGQDGNVVSVDFKDKEEE